jgi:hypothetical protein
MDRTNRLTIIYYEDIIKGKNINIQQYLAYLAILTLFPESYPRLKNTLIKLTRK